MRTTKEIFNSNLEKNITFEYFSPDGYRVYSDKDSKKPYFHYKTTKNERIKVHLDIDDINAMEKVKCPECKQDDYLKIQKSDGKNTKYVCKNKTCGKNSFRYQPYIKTKTLGNLIKSYFDLKSIKRHKDVYNKYKSMKENNQRIDIEDTDITILEHYLILGVSRKLIAKLFSIDARTVRRLIIREEANNKSKFQKRDLLIGIDQQIKIHKIIAHAYPLKSKIFYTETTFTVDFKKEDYETFENLKYYRDEKTTKASKN